MKKYLLSFFKNEISVFTLVKYFSYFLNFLRVIIAAKILGPFYFGIWGFLNLLVQYLSHTLLGIQYAINLELAIREPDNADKEVRMISSALFLTLVISSIIVFFAFLVNFVGLTIFTEYQFEKYGLLVGLVVALLHFQQVFFNIYRVYGRLYTIAFAELIVSISMLVVLFLFKGDDLIYTLFVTWIASMFISLLFFLIAPPVRLKVVCFAAESMMLLKVGLPLLIYNLAYYLIVVSSTTILSVFYSVETMGYYTLSNGISNAILLGINAVLWIFFPVFLTRLKEGSTEEETKHLIEKITNNYVAAVFVIFILFLLFSPLLYWGLEKYSPAETTLNLLLVTQIILASNFAANTLSMARRKYLHLTFLSLISTVVVTLFSLIFAFFNMPYYWIAFSTVLGAIAFSVATRIYLHKQIPGIRADIFRITSRRIALFVILIGNLFFHSYLYLLNGVGILIYLIYNGNRLKDLFEIVKSKMVSRGEVAAKI